MVLHVEAVGSIISAPKNTISGSLSNPVGGTEDAPVQNTRMSSSVHMLLPAAQVKMKLIIIAREL